MRFSRQERIIESVKKKFCVDETDISDDTKKGVTTVKLHCKYCGSEATVKIASDKFLSPDDKHKFVCHSPDCIHQYQNKSVLRKLVTKE